jgi:hypothetical protein
MVAHWRAPPVEHDEAQPELGKIVSFLLFHVCSLGYSAHPFLLGMLNKWDVDTNGKKIFAECQMFRVFFFGHSAKSFFAECRSLPSAFFRHSAKKLFAECLF